ncbi:transcription factor BYE1 [Yarrowia lipolytica]|uniref:Transcription factor BYE1 n=1 Tax=Yarrowia lipolytica TaxID=4952 RepID=A0A371CBK8_YARLL|nr:transcription factor BYE1 [Yarrowia lipolytica]RDW32022.1 transcription factor BYE1 [Yarrowia lipolytica]RDW49358.1 transcription factor BYE1 [Yarrowia lipolytica]RDW51641.1 transcription factor BYE1 [Yarrowia lipolytica]
MEVDGAEPARRRSTRATRGRHSKYEEAVEEPGKVKSDKKDPKTSDKNPKTTKLKTPTKAKTTTRSKARKKSKNDEEGVVRCPCGATEDDPSDGKIMIECEDCLEWQHSQCVLQTNDLEQVPDHYVCNECTEKKTQEKETTEAQEESEDKGKGEEEKDSNDKDEKYDSTYVPNNETAEKEPVARVSKSTHKRVGHIDDITEKVRKSAASALKGIFVSVPTSKYSPGAGVSPEQFCETLALTIEQELYDAYGTVEPEIGSNYRDKFRTLSFNLRDSKNETLRIRVMTGQVTPQTLVAMSSEEMMNPELQKLAEEVRAEAIRDTVLVVDEAPRLRRTHKGEEIVGEYEEYIDNVDQALKMEKQRDGDGKEAAESRNQIERAVRDIEGANGEADSKTSNSPKESSNSPIVPKWKRDIDLAQGESDHEHDHDHNSDHEDKVNGILGDVSREAREAETDDWTTISEAPFVWTGTVPMAGLDKTSCAAFSLGSSSVHFNPNVSWGSVFYASKPLTIEGRLDKSKADPYLSKVLGAGTRDVAAFCLLPSDSSESDREAYYKLYEYFHSRSKYGVIHNRSTLVKDAYLIPLAPDDAPPYTLGSLVKPSVELSSLKRSRPLLVALYIVGKLSPKRGAAVSVESHVASSEKHPPKRQSMRDRVKQNAGNAGNASRRASDARKSTPPVTATPVTPAAPTLVAPVNAPVGPAPVVPPYAGFQGGVYGAPVGIQRVPGAPMGVPGVPIAPAGMPGVPVAPLGMHGAPAHHMAQSGTPIAPAAHPRKPTGAPPPDLDALKTLLNDPNLRNAPAAPAQNDLLQNPALLMSIIDQAKKR